MNKEELLELETLKAIYKDKIFEELYRREKVLKEAIDNRFNQLQAYKDKEEKLRKLAKSFYLVKDEDIFQILNSKEAK